MHVAGFWRRAAAALVDLAILAVTAGPLQMLLGLLLPATELAPGSSGIDAALQVASADLGSVAARFAPFMVMTLLYLGLFHAVTGRTPGQALLGIRVVDGGGHRPRAGIAAVRLAAMVAGLLPGALGALWIAFDSERRAFHDHVARTWVVRDS